MAIPLLTVDPQAQAHHYLSQINRLALLVSGDRARSDDLTAAAFASVSWPLPSGSNAEMMLARALLQPQTRSSGRRTRWTWQSDLEARERAALKADEASALLKLLAACRPDTRLLLGLHLLWGLAPAESAVALDVAPIAIYELRVAAARALHYVPADADPGLMLQIAQLLGGDLIGEEALAVRGTILADEHARVLRDGLLRVERTLQVAIPALFAAAPSPNLQARVERAITLDKPPAQPSKRSLQQHPRLILTAVVLLLIGGMLALPLLRQRLTPTAAAPTTAPSSPGALVEAAIHRLDRPALGEDVLHETYRGEVSGVAWTLERWYDYGDTHRLSVIVRPDGNDTIVYGVATDGQGRVQYRTNPWRQRGEQATDLDITLPPDEIGALLPILRQQPDATFFNASSLPDLSRFYLAQARATLPTTLGETNVAGRNAQIVAYSTDQPLPTIGRRQPTPRASRVLLTIDSATATLLDVAVLPDGEGENAAIHPWRSTLFELRETAPDTVFALPGTASNQRSSLANPRAPASFNNNVLTLQQALSRDQQPLYAPQTLPEDITRSMALGLGTGSDVALAFEGEFSSVLVSSASLLRSGEAFDAPERVAGAFSYRVGSMKLGGTVPISVAQVTRSDNADFIAHVYLLNQYATDQEREAQIERIIGSLQPVTSANVDTLGRSFYTP